jgi:hypothetical protein
MQSDMLPFVRPLFQSIAFIAEQGMPPLEGVISGKYFTL